MSEHRYLELRETVTLPATAVAEPWQTASFDAWLTTTSGDKLLQGLLVRTGRDEGSAAGLEAYCVICPHEICHVEYVRETAEVRMDKGDAPQRPLLVCPCHFSVFDPRDRG